MVGPALHPNLHAIQANRADPSRLVLAERQSYCDFHVVFGDQLLLQRAPTASDIEDAGSAIGTRLLNVVLEFPLLSRFERVRFVAVQGARITKVTIEE